MAERATAKDQALSSIDDAMEDLVTLSHRIHSDPELAFEEERASEWVAGALAEAGLSVERGVAELPTALVATAGNGPVVIGIFAEYDALPGIGHACGHNVIAAAAVGAGLALAPLADDLGITVKVFGTPAEEGGGGKILMLERGAFAGVDAAMMVHPAPAEALAMHCRAVSQYEFQYHGKESHASGFPEAGVNAADAVTVAQVGIGLIRQHLRPHDQVHGIVTKGGDAPNVVPSHTVARYLLRSADLDSLAELEPRILNCFEAGAVATGARFEHRRTAPTYSQLRSDPAMEAAYKRNAEDLGRSFADLGPRGLSGSTDMANVSLVIPSIHPMLGINSWPAVNHQAEFAGACVQPAADRAVRDGAAAMAWTSIDLATDPDLRSALRTD